MSSRAEIDLMPGERPRAIDAIIKILQGCGGLYERSGELVRICNKHILPVDECWLTDYLARHVRFFVHKRSGKDRLRREIDPPGWLAKTIVSKSGERGLPELIGVITAPTLRPDDSVICSLASMLKPAYFFNPINGLRSLTVQLLRPSRSLAFPLAPLRGISLRLGGGSWGGGCGDINGHPSPDFTARAGHQL